MAATQNTRMAIRMFVADKLGDAEFGDDTDIFSLGFVNSLFAMELVLFIEKTVKSTVPDDELELANFRSVDAMCQLVGRLDPVPSNA